jgi:hypothetical protein
VQGSATARSVGLVGGPLLLDGVRGLRRLSLREKVFSTQKRRRHENRGECNSEKQFVEKSLPIPA